MSQETYVVVGAGGFIGGHLVSRLLGNEYRVRAIDIKPINQWWQIHKEATNWAKCDLREYEECRNALGEFNGGDYATHIFNLACDMGGIGFIEANKARCMESVLINTNLLRAAHYYCSNIKRYFYSSSACVYHALRQKSLNSSALSEDDAYLTGGAMPEDGYGWEKLFSERMCRHFNEDYSIPVRIARFHNIYGPHGSWCDGREKAPAAICRKIALAKRDGLESIELWGSAETTRSFCWIQDCLEGVLRLVDSEHTEPLNIGSDELVTIEQLAHIIMNIADYPTKITWDNNKPHGVVGRNSNNNKIKQVLGWQPSTSLKVGLGHTYKWIAEEIAAGKSKTKDRAGC